jgi:hypothetical protein
MTLRLDYSRVEEAEVTPNFPCRRKEAVIRFTSTDLGERYGLDAAGCD